MQNKCNTVSPTFNRVMGNLLRHCCFVEKLVFFFNRTPSQACFRPVTEKFDITWRYTKYLCEICLFQVFPPLFHSHLSDQSPFTSFKISSLCFKRATILAHSVSPLPIPSRLVTLQSVCCADLVRSNVPSAFFPSSDDCTCVERGVYLLKGWVHTVCLYVCLP